MASLYATEATAYSKSAPLGEDLLLGAAGRLSCGSHNRVRLALANDALCQKLLCRLRNRGNVLPMVLPGAAGVESWACTRRQLVDAAAAGIHKRAQRRIRAGIHIV